MQLYTLVHDEFNNDVDNQQQIWKLIEFGSPSGAASNLGLTIVTLADFSDYYYEYYGWDFLYNYNGQDFFIIIIVVFL